MSRPESAWEGAAGPRSRARHATADRVGMPGRRETCGRARFVGIAVVALASLVQPASAQEMSPGDTIRVLRESSNHALAAHDVPRLMAFFSPDYTSTAGNGTQIRSLGELRTLLTRRFDRAPELAYVRTPAEVAVSDDGMRAFETGTWTTVDPQAPPGEVLPGGRYSAMWVRTGEGWKIHSELFTTLVGG